MCAMSERTYRVVTTEGAQLGPEFTASSRADLAVFLSKRAEHYPEFSGSRIGVEERGELGEWNEVPDSWVAVDDL